MQWQAQVTDDRTYMEIAFKIKYKLTAFLEKSRSKPDCVFCHLAEVCRCHFSHKKAKNTSNDI